MFSYRRTPLLARDQSGGIALRFIHFVLAVFFHATIFLVALVGLAHIWLPIVADYKWVIEKEVSDFVGNPVTIESIAVDWQSEAPRWVLNNLQLYDADSNAVQIEVEKLYLTLDRRESLRTVRLQPRDVRVENVKFRVVQQQAGNFTVPGLVFPLPGQSNLELGTTRETPIELTVEGGEITWQAVDDKREVVLSDVQFEGVFDTKQISVDLSARFPEKVGERLLLTSELQLVKSGVWDGEATVQAAVKRLAALPLPQWQSLGLVDAGLDVNGSLKLRQNQPVHAHGLLALQKPEFIQSDLPLAPLERLSLEGSVEANSENLWLGNLAVTHQLRNRTQHEQSTVDFGVLRRHEQLHISTSLDRLDLGYYLPLLVRQGWIPQGWREALGQMQPKGRIDTSEVHFIVDEAQRRLLSYNIKGQVNALSIQESEQLPGISGVNTTFQFNEKQGSLDISLADSAVHMQQWFDKPLPLSALQLGVDWQQLKHQRWQLVVRELALENRDVVVTGDGKAVWGGDQAPDVKLDLAFASQRVLDNVRDYIPKVTPAATKTWLEHGIVQGFVPEGTLALWGNPLAYPFDKPDTGGLDIRFKVERGILDYLPEWPQAHEVSGDLRFLNRTMSAKVRGGRIGDVRVTGGQVFIGRMGSDYADLKLDLDSQGTLPGYFDYLQKIPPTQAAKRFIQAATFDGVADLNIKVATPLVDERFEQLGVDVQGALQLQDATFVIPEFQQKFTAINGQVQFDRYGVHAQQVTASYQGRPVTVQAQTSDDRQSIRVNLQQRNQAKRVLPAVVRHWGAFASGESLIKVGLTLPSFVAGNDEETNAQPPRIHLRAQSDLQGSVVHLPAPFSKAAEQVVPLQVDMSIPLQAGGAWHTRVDYGKQLNAVYVQTDRKNDPLRLGIVLGETPATLPESGVTLFGALPQTDVVAWSDVWARAVPSGNVAGKVVPPLLVDVTVKKLLVGDWLLGHSRFRADSRKGLTLNVQSPVVQLAVNNPVRPQLDQQAQVNVKLNQVDFAQLARSWQQVQGKRRAPSGAGKALLPGEFPNVTLRCVQCRWDALPIDALNVVLQGREPEVASALGREVQLKTLELKSGSLRLLADGGTWRRLSQHSRQSRTSLSTSLQIEKPNAFLKSVGVDAGLTGGFLQADGQLAWQGAPFAFNARSLEGAVHVNMGAGALTEVEPGFGRLLGLLDVQRLPQRFMGGFGDVTRKGAQFDGIKGDLQVKGGKVSTQNIVIRSPALVAGIKGESDLIARTHNQRVTVIPKLESTVPVIGAVLGGVGVGAALALVNAVRKDNPEQTLKNDNSAFAIRYRVTGAWRDPQIDEVKKTPRREEDVDVFSE